jgi:hypothetical protein
MIQKAEVLEEWSNGVMYELKMTMNCYHCVLQYANTPALQMHLCIDRRKRIANLATW